MSLRTATCNLLSHAVAYCDKANKSQLCSSHHVKSFNQMRDWEAVVTTHSIGTCLFWVICTLPFETSGTASCGSTGIIWSNIFIKVPSMPFNVYQVWLFWPGLRRWQCLGDSVSPSSRMETSLQLGGMSLRWCCSWAQTWQNVCFEIMIIADELKSIKTQLNLLRSRCFDRTWAWVEVIRATISAEWPEFEITSSSAAFSLKTDGRSHGPSDGERRAMLERLACAFLEAAEDDEELMNHGNLRVWRQFKSVLDVCFENCGNSDRVCPKGFPLLEWIRETNSPKWSWRPFP